MRISDWSSDVCSSDLAAIRPSPVALSSRWAGEAIIRRKQPPRHARGHKKITTAAVAGDPPTRALVCRLFFEEEQSESVERRANWNATRIVVRKTQGKKEEGRDGKERVSPSQYRGLPTK